MTGEQRVQRRVECPFDDVNLGDECHLTSFLPTCRGCNNDGTRWVTVGTLKQPSVVDPDGCWVPTWDFRRSNPTCLQHLGSEKGQKLYVVEEES